MDIAHGFLNEDSFLISEVLFNPFSAERVAKIRDNMATLLEIIETKDKARLDAFVSQAKKNVEG